MDITELSQKLEANLLETHSRTPHKKPHPNNTFSPPITRSQTNNNKNTSLVEEKLTKLQIRKTRCKEDNIEKIYLNKKAKVVHKNLETIYEDPIWKKGSTMLLGTSKVKRSIYLDREFRITSKQKSKLRKLKIKRLGKRIKSFKMTDDEFKSKMMTIENYINDNDNDNDVDVSCDDEGFDDVPYKSNGNDDCNDVVNGNFSNESNKDSDNGSKDIGVGESSLSLE